MGDDRGGVLNFEALNVILSCVQKANTYLNSKVGPESELWSRLRVGEREDAEHFRGKWYGRSLGGDQDILLWFCSSLDERNKVIFCKWCITTYAEGDELWMIDVMPMVMYSMKRLQLSLYSECCLYRTLKAGHINKEPGTRYILATDACNRMWVHFEQCDRSLIPASVGWLDDDTRVLFECRFRREWLLL